MANKTYPFRTITGVSLYDIHTYIIQWLKSDDLTVLRATCRTYRSWIDLKYCDRGDHFCQRVARVGNLKRLKWAISLGFQLDENIFHSAISSIDESRRSIKLLAFLQPLIIDRIKYRWHERIAQKAARIGNLEVLQLFSKVMVIPNYSIIIVDRSIRYNHLEILKWIRPLQCQSVIWTYTATETALTSGNLHVMRWLMENGGIINDDTFLSVLRREFDVETKINFLNLLKKYRDPNCQDLRWHWWIQNSDPKIIEWIIHNSLND